MNLQPKPFLRVLLSIVLLFGLTVTNTAQSKDGAKSVTDYTSIAKITSTAEGKTIKYTNPYTHNNAENFAGVFNGTLNGNAEKFYCIDLQHGLAFNDDYWDEGSTPSEITYILNNYFPYKTSYSGKLSDNNEEAAAVQFSIWHFSDGVDPNTITNNNNVKNRANAIIADANANHNTMEFLQTLLIIPPSQSFVQGTPANFDIYTTDVNGNPLSGITVQLSTTLGTLSTTSVVTDANGHAGPITLNYSGLGIATIKAKADIEVPQGTRYVHKASPDTKQKLVLATPSFDEKEVTGTVEWYVPEDCDLKGYTTFTPGGWGGPSNSTPGKIRDMYFDDVFPGSLIVGGTYTLELTSAQAVEDFLPSSGTPAALTQNYVDPNGSLSNTLAGHVVALKLAVEYDKAGYLGTNPTDLEDLYIAIGPFEGFSVQQFLAFAESVLGGGSLNGFTYSEVTDAATAINENFVDGTTNNGFLDCEPELCFNKIGDFVWHDKDVDGIQDANEPGIANVVVELLDGSDNLISTTTTNANGYYEFANLANGTYKVRVASSNYSVGGVLESTTQTKWYSTKKNMGSDDGKDSDASKNESVTVTLNCNDNLTIDFGFYKTCVSVVKTADKQTAEPGDVITYTFTVENCGDITLSGGVDLYDAMINPLGDHKIGNLSPVYPGTTKSLTKIYTVKDTDCGELVNTVTAIGHPDDQSANVEFTTTATVFIDCKASLGDKVWFDTDQDGIQESGENGVPDVTVNLYDCDNNFISTMTTDANGNYLFANLNPGDYYVEFILPSGFVFTLKNAGSDNAKDSDADLTTGKTICTTLTIGENDLTWDAGIYEYGCTGEIGDFVWLDYSVNGGNKNCDGIQNPGEPGIPNVTVILKNNSGTIIATTVTDANGKYLFEIPIDCKAECFTVLVDESTLPAGYTRTAVEVGTDDSKDSNPIPSPVCLSEADNFDYTIDFGYCPPPLCENKIGDFIWHDTDVDGIQDANESGIPNVVVELLDGSGSLLTTDITDSNGKYEFAGLASGTYKVRVASSNYSVGGVLESTTQTKWYSTKKNQGSDDAKDSDADKNESVTVTLNCNDNPTIDFGFYKTCVSISKTGPLTASPGDLITYTFTIENCGDITLSGGVDIYDPLFNPNNHGDDNNGDDDGDDNDGDDDGDDNDGDDDGDDNNGDDDGDDNNGDDDGDDNNGDDDGDDNNGDDDGDDNNGDDDGDDNNGDDDGDDNDGDDDGDDNDGDDDGDDNDGDDDGDDNDGDDDGDDNDFTEDDIIKNITPLYPGEIKSFTMTFLVTEEFCEDGQIVNCATAIGHPIDGSEDVMDSDCWTTIVECEQCLNKIGDYVWHDIDTDGVQDANEPGLENVVVELLDAQGNLLQTTVTDNNGYYFFNNLPSATYKVRIAASNFTSGVLAGSQSEKWFLTFQNSGSDDAKDSDGDNNKTATVTVNCNEDLTIDFGFFKVCVSLIKTGPASVNAGETITYSFTVTNCGDVLLSSGAMVYDPMLNPSGDHKIKDLELNPGESKTFTFEYETTPNDCGQLINEAWVIGHPYLTNYNFGGTTVRYDDNHTVTVICEGQEADLEINKTSSTTNPECGEQFSFTITIKNNGPDTSEDIIASDLLPIGADYISHTTSQGTYNSATGLWNVGDLNSGSTATLTIDVKVDCEQVNNSTFDLGVASDYNLFVIEDVDQPSSDTQGKVAVGGDAKFANYSIGDQLPPNSGDVLIVGGNLTFTSGRVYNGNVVYGISTNLPAPGVTVDGTISQGYPIDFAAAKTFLESLSLSLSGYTVNGTTTFQWGGLTLSGTDPFLNVFSVSGANLSAANNVSINVPNGSAVLVNIDGYTINWTGGLSVNGTAINNVLYNFYQATSMTIQGIDIRGSILAPFAEINFAAGVINGQMICKSLIGMGQMNNSPFGGNIPGEDIINVAIIVSSSTPDPNPNNNSDMVEVIVGGNDNGGNNGGNNNDDNNWQYVSGFGVGEIVYSMVFDGQNIYAGTWGGKIYMSSNNGQTWTVINAGMNVSYIWSLQISGGYIFAATEFGVYKFNGTSWSLTSLTGIDVHSLAVSGGVIYAGTWGLGVYQSTDNGTTWLPMNNGLSYFLTIQSVTATASGELFAASVGGGVFKYQGSVWVNVNLGYNYVWTMNSSSNVIYAGTYGDGLYRSFDGGTTWSKVTTLNAPFIYSISVSGSGKVYVASWASGVFESTDNGNSWTSLGLGGFGVSSLMVPSGSEDVFVGTKEGQIYMAKFDDTATDVNDGLSEVPSEFELNQNYPNPFNPSTTIQFAVPKAGNYSVKVFNVLGQEVATLLNEEIGSGIHKVTFDAGNLSSGIYVYRLVGNNVNISKKMILTK